MVRVARDAEGRALGFIAVKQGDIAGFYVAGASRGQGIGKALVGAALEALRAEGIHKAALVVMANNTAGNAFWEQLGCTPRPDLVYRNRELDELLYFDT